MDCDGRDEPPTKLYVEVPVSRSIIELQGSNLILSGRVPGKSQLTSVYWFINSSKTKSPSAMQSGPNPIAILESL